MPPPIEKYSRIISRGLRNTFRPRWTTIHFLTYATLRQLDFSVFRPGYEFVSSFKYDWIRYHRVAIKSAARANEYPALLLAGVAWQEVGGGHAAEDWAAFAIRSADAYRPSVLDTAFPILAKDPKDTSFGPIQMQLDVAAETKSLDFSQLHLVDKILLMKLLERDEANIVLAAKHLRYLIDYDDLQTTPPKLSDESIAIAATRYNRGIEPNLDEIKRGISYGEGIIKRKEKILKALL